MAAKVAGEEITLAQVEKNIEADIFELEKKLYELRYNKLKPIIINKLAAEAAKGKGLSPEEFLKREVLTNTKPSKEAFEKFVKERNIPKKRLDEHLTERVYSFLTKQLQEKATDRWLAKKNQKEKVELYLKRPERPFFEVELGDAPIKGGPNAKVTIVEFSDFECRYCIEATDLLRQIEKKFGKQVRIVFKHFPLPFHRKARGAANAAMCAHEQDKKAFWKLHDMMFGRPEQLDAKGLEKMAKKVGLDMKKFQKCAKENKYGAFVQKDIDQGKSLGVQSTPTFFINGRIVKGIQELEVFEEEIRQYL